VRAYAAENFFDMTLLPTGTERLPATWITKPVGVLRKALFGSPEMAARLGRPLTTEKLQGVPFVGPIYNADGQFVSVDDDCPLRHTERTVGHEAQTIGLALELAARTDQVVFGPVIAARRHLEARTLVELEVEGWDVKDPLTVASNGDRVRSRVEASIIKAIQAELSVIDPGLSGKHD
jgi:hypothetical protein